MVTKQQLKNLFLYYLPPIVWMGVIFAFSAQGVIKTTDFYWTDFMIKKTAHLVEYFVLAVLVYRALFKAGVTRKKSIIITLVFCVLYAMSDEWHQSFTPGREPRIRDVVIDSVGVIFGVLTTHKV